MRLGLLLLLGLLIGCEPAPKHSMLNTTTYKIDMNNYIHKIEIDGKQYLVYEGYKAGNIIPVEDCKCKE